MFYTSSAFYALLPKFFGLMTQIKLCILAHEILISRKKIIQEKLTLKEINTKNISNENFFLRR